MWKILWVCGLSSLSLISAWNVPMLYHRRAQQLRLSEVPLSSAASNHVEYEEEARNIATGVLQSVFVGENATKVERALKTALRSIEDGSKRKRVSQLVLGTSVMRKRHDYVYETTVLDKKGDKIRSLVDLHAAHLNSETLADNIIWPSDPMERIAVEYSMPTFLVKLWIEEYGEDETKALCTISNRPGPITLRRNAIRCSSDKQLVLRLLEDEGVQLSPPNFAVPGGLRMTSGRPRSIWAMEAWRDGWFEVQDSGSMLIVAAMELNIDDKVVVDYCAGNGGKSLAMISKLYELNISATVWAHDVEKMRLAQ